jgi:hypothetical protein
LLEKHFLGQGGKIPEEAGASSYSESKELLATKGLDQKETREECPMGKLTEYIKSIKKIHEFSMIQK